MRAIPGLTSWIDDVQVVTWDYPTVGTVGQARACLETLYPLGRLDTVAYPAIPTGGGDIFVAGDPAAGPGGVFFSAPNRILGVAIDWGVGLQFQPGSLVITFETVNWTNQFGPDLDRRVVTQAGRSNGSSIFLPFAQRSAGMSQAQMQLAEIFDAAPVANIPIVRITVPPGVGANFQANITLMTAFHQRTALYSSLNGLYNGGAVGGQGHFVGRQ
jgi:hypothetical protein